MLQTGGKARRQNDIIGKEVKGENAMRRIMNTSFVCLINCEGTKTDRRLPE